MKLKAFLEQATLTEGKDFFPDVDVIKLDPDRVDVYDIVSALMPTLVRMAYVDLSHDKEKYERTHTDEEDEPFNFTVDELEDRLDKIIDNLKNRIDDMSSRDKHHYIDAIKKEFKEELK
jgi:hypothetical protein